MASLRGGVLSVLVAIAVLGCGKEYAVHCARIYSEMQGINSRVASTHNVLSWHS